MVPPPILHQGFAVPAYLGGEGIAGLAEDINERHTVLAAVGCSIFTGRSLSFHLPLRSLRPLRP